MNVPLWLEIATLVGFLVVLVLDFFVVDRRPHAFSTKEALRWVTVYVSLAIAFNILIYQMFGGEAAGQFTAAYLTEQALSVDNLFVFLVIMTSFSVPKEAQHRVLLVGVLIAIALRAVMIVVGVAAIQNFKPTFLIFGLFLFWTAIKVARDKHEEEVDIRDKRLMRITMRLAPTHHEYDGHKLTTMVDGKRHLTPMVLVMVAIGGTDVMFALDSIPAVLGLTSETFLVLTSNAFALMGLRQIYFLLNTLISRLIHLTRGLAIVLGFIAVKLLLLGIEATFNVAVPHVNTFVSLAVIIAVLAITTITSLYATRRDRQAVSEAVEDAS